MSLKRVRGQRERTEGVPRGAVGKRGREPGTHWADMSQRLGAEAKGGGAGVRSLGRF